jgi:uncharacterized repeat protein (TIGR03833 family)
MGQNVILYPSRKRHHWAVGMSPHRNERGSMDGTNRANMKAGSHVLIVLKKDQHSGKLTEGIVKDVLTKSPTHPHGIKVRLESGEIGRVKKIM